MIEARDLDSERKVGVAVWQHRARALRPLIASFTKDIDRSGALPPALLDALHGAQLFRMLLPKSLGGGETDPISFTQTIEELAKADASTAWCVGQASGCAFSAAYLEPKAAAEIFSDSRAVVAWGPASHHARAVAHADGYRVTGSWNYGSGSRHATWLGAHVAIYEEDGSPRLAKNGKHVEKTMLFPRSAAQIEDVWQVVGLRGTGSDTYALEGHFIPERFVYERDSDQDRREDGPLYRFGILATYGMAFASVALGVAQGMMDAFVDMASKKAAKRSAQTLRENASIQAMVGLCAAKMRGSRAFLHTSIADMWSSLCVGDKLSVDQRLGFRLAVTHGMREARAVVDDLYDAAGATAIFESEGFERRFRDIHAVVQQIQGQARNYETAGQVLLGLGGESPRL